MDAENGVATENENGIMERTPLVDGLVTSSGKRNENVEHSVDSLQLNDISDDLSKVESLNSGVLEDEVSSTAVSESQSSTVVKVYYWNSLNLYLYLY